MMTINSEPRQRPQARRGAKARRVSSGDHIKVDTPVPIPNTEVKHFEPMIVLQVRK